MTDVVGKLWGFCHTLRHDGVDYGDYIEQLTYLLFLKMADERGIELPAETDWPYLRKQSGTELLDAYVEALRTLGKQPGILGDIFGGAQNRFTNPVNLQQAHRPRSTRPSGPASTSTSRPPPSKGCWRRPRPRARRAPASTSRRAR